MGVRFASSQAGISSNRTDPIPAASQQKSIQYFTVQLWKILGFGGRYQKSLILGASHDQRGDLNLMRISRPLQLQYCVTCNIPAHRA